MQFFYAVRPSPVRDQKLHWLDVAHGSHIFSDGSERTNIYLAAYYPIDAHSLFNHHKAPLSL
jgi:hypothetical protein